MRARLSRMAAIRPVVAVLAAGPMSHAYSQEPPIYGSQLMIEQERAEYRARMHTATSEQQREQIRLELRTQMQERAAEPGIELPDVPPMTGRGRGRGQGKGMGAGHGGKMRQSARSGRGNCQQRSSAGRRARAGAGALLRLTWQNAASISGPMMPKECA